MARPRKNNTASNKDVSKETIIKEEKIETSLCAEEAQIHEEKIVESKIEEIIPETEIVKEEVVEIPVVGSAVQFVDEPIVDKDNFKKVEVISDEDKKYHMDISEVIIRLKKEAKYKFLSKVALIKIATDIVNKKYYSK